MMRMGALLKLNSFNTLSKEFCNVDLSEFLDEQFSLASISTSTPCASLSPALPLYHLIGALDPSHGSRRHCGAARRQTAGDPGRMDRWPTRLTHLKIKLAGDQLDWDVERVLAIEKSRRMKRKAQRGCTALVLFLRLQ
jgi:hypothetical protein